MCASIALLPTDEPVEANPASCELGRVRLTRRLVLF
jgi:hypothetical protein